MRSREAINRAKRKYRNTPKGYLTYKYYDMKKRVSGKGLERTRHLYEGLEICDKESFLRWALEEKEFYSLWDIYHKTGKQRRMSPSIDRIDSSKGYTIENMQFVSQADNARDGANTTNKKSGK